jgi:hypothetical protein
MAYNIAAGTEWMGHRVRQASVLYLPYEGMGGLKKRGEALRKRYGTADVPFFIDDSRYNVREAAGRQALAAAIATLPEVPKLIVFDTFAHALCGGDENSAQDVGEFNAAVSGLIKATGACVLVLHHPRKDGSGGPRGSGALGGAIDLEIEVSGHTVQSTKQRDFDLGDPIGFRLEPVVVGMDEDEEEITSCVVRERKVSTSGPVAKLTGKYKLAWEKLNELRPDNSGVTDVEWKQACEEFVGTRRQAWPEVRSRLRQLLTIGDDGLVRRRLE